MYQPLKPLALASVILLAGCAGQQGGVFSGFQQKVDAKVQTQLDALQKDVGQLLQMGHAAMAKANAVALAATPPDQDFVNCFTAADAVLTAAEKVTATSQGAGNGAIVAAEIGTLYMPGSDQYNWAKSQLVSGCSAKVQKVMGNVAGAGGVLAAIPTLLKLAPLAGA